MGHAAHHSERRTLLLLLDPPKPFIHVGLLPPPSRSLRPILFPPPPPPTSEIPHRSIFLPLVFTVYCKEGGIGRGRGWREEGSRPCELGPFTQRKICKSRRRRIYSTNLLAVSLLLSVNCALHNSCIQWVCVLDNNCPPKYSFVVVS